MSGGVFHQRPGVVPQAGEWAGPLAGHARDVLSCRQHCALPLYSGVYWLHLFMSLVVLCAYMST